MTFEHETNRPDDDDRPMSMLAAPFGKLDAKVEEFRIEGSTLDRMRASAAELGMNLTDFIRMSLRISAWGEEHVVSIALGQIRRVGNRGGSVSGRGGVAP